MFMPLDSLKSARIAIVSNPALFTTHGSTIEALDLSGFGACALIHAASLSLLSWNCCIAETVWYRLRLQLFKIMK